VGLLADFENEAKAIFDEVDAEVKSLGALIYEAIQQTTSMLEREALDAIPQMAAKLKIYAGIMVKQIANDPQLLDAAGHWKFGTAAARVWALLKADFPHVEQIGAAALNAAIETAVQAAFAAMVL
jgi:hypothetical protein